MEKTENGKPEEQRKPTPRKAEKKAKGKKPLAPEQKAKYRKIGCAAALVLVGAAAGAGAHMLLTSPGSTALTGQTQVAKDRLDTAVGTYTLGGQTHQVTAREALVAAGALNANEDGSYDMPSVEDVLVVARSAAMGRAADERGITVSDDEIETYVKDTFGTDSLDAAAEVYGYTADELKRLVTDAIKSQKLYVDVTGNEGGVGDAPSAPADGLEGADAAEYIIKLAGDSWDAEKGAWKDAKGDLAKAVGDFDGKTATHEQATAAYDAAYRAWSQSMDDVIGKWDDFCSETYKDVTVTCATAMAS